MELAHDSVRAPSSAHHRRGGRPYERSYQGCQLYPALKKLTVLAAPVLPERLPLAGNSASHSTCHWRPKPSRPAHSLPALLAKVLHWRVGRPQHAADSLDASTPSHDQGKSRSSHH